MTKSPVDGSTGSIFGVSPYERSATRGSLDGCVHSRRAQAFADAFRASHPSTPAHRAARLLRERYRERWSGRALAKAIAVGHATLLRDFEGAFGVSIHAYHRAVRVVAALEQLRDNNTEAVAVDVGYRSRKDLYRALDEVTGLTPARFKELSPDTASDLIDRLQLQIAGA